MNLKQAILLRKDLKMSAGKAATQAAHASVGTLIQKIEKDKIDYWASVSAEWAKNGQKKICLRVNSEKELRDIEVLAIIAGIPCMAIIDSGKTEFNGVPTLTALGIGPATDEQIDKLTRHLKLYK